MRVAGQRVAIRVPRVREVTGRELPLRSYQALHGDGALNIPEAQAVSVVEPDGMADDFGRKAMPMVAGPASVHPGIVPGGELT